MPSLKPVRGVLAEAEGGTGGRAGKYTSMSRKPSPARANSDTGHKLGGKGMRGGNDGNVGGMLCMLVSVVSLLL